MAHPSGREITKNDDRRWQRRRYEVGAKSSMTKEE